jgi:hypothetical protein
MQVHERQMPVGECQAPEGVDEVADDDWEWTEDEDHEDLEEVVIEGQAEEENPEVWTQLRAMLVDALAKVHLPEVRSSPCAKHCSCLLLLMEASFTSSRCCCA